MKNTNKYNEENKITLQGGGGGGNSGSGDNPGGPECCDQAPIPPGAPDTYWIWPPYVKNISPNGYEERWFQRDFLTENLLIERGEIQHTLLYFEELTEEYGGAVSSVWAQRANAIIAPGNSFVGDLTIIGDPQGWKPSQFVYPRPVPQPDGSQLTPFMLKGKIQIQNLCKIKRAGGYIFEVMKYINSNDLAGDGSTKLLGDYASIFSGSEFITQSAPPSSSTVIDPSKVYNFQKSTTTQGPNFSVPTEESEGMSIIKNYILKLSAVTGDTGFVNSWNSVNCTNNITAPPKSSASPREWNFDEVLEALKDPWLGWGVDGRPDGQLLAGLGGDPGGNFNIMDPSKPINTIKQTITSTYQFITGRTYYIDICGASKAYARWKQFTNPNYDFNPDIQDYPSIRNAIQLEKLKSACKDQAFRAYLIKENLLTTAIKPYRLAVDDAFMDFVGWYTSYGAQLAIKVWGGNKEIGVDETAKVDGQLCHRIYWEDAGLEVSNSLSTEMAKQYGQNLIIGPNTIEDQGSASDSDPVCLEYCIYTYSTQYNCPTQTWSQVIRSGPVRGPKPKPDEVFNDWVINNNNGNATYKVYTIPDYKTNECPADIPEPKEELTLMPSNYCSCVKTWNATYSCDSFTWDIGQPTETFERNPQGLNTWIFGTVAAISPSPDSTTSGPSDYSKCEARQRKASFPCAGFSHEDKFVLDTTECCASIETPEEPPFPTQCCKKNITGTLVDEAVFGAGCCYDSSVYIGTYTNPLPFPSSADGAKCDPVSAGTLSLPSPVVDPPNNITPEELAKANKVTSAGATGAMLDTLSISADGKEIASITNSGSTSIPGEIGIVPVGTNVLEGKVIKCSVQTGTWVRPQGTDYVYLSEYNLWVYRDSAPIGDGNNDLPPDTPVDINFN